MANDSNHLGFEVHSEEQYLPTPAASGSRTPTAPPTTLLLQSKKNTVLKSHGRPPWCVVCLYLPHTHWNPFYALCRYGEDGKVICDAFVIGIAGTSVEGILKTIIMALTDL